jgi:hypothetical protein
LLKINETENYRESEKEIPMKQTMALALVTMMMTAASVYAEADNAVQTDTNLQTTIEHKAVDDKAAQPEAAKTGVQTEATVQTENQQAAPAADKSADPGPTSMEQGAQVEAKAAAPSAENFFKMFHGKKQTAEPASEASVGTDAEVKQ